LIVTVRLHVTIGRTIAKIGARAGHGMTNDLYQFGPKDVFQGNEDDIITKGVICTDRKNCLRRFKKPSQPKDLDLLQQEVGE